MTGCHYASCDRDATVILAYTEPGTPRTTKPACNRHRNTERIHDPLNVHVDEVLR